MTVLNETRKIRYHRNILISEIGIPGQQKLLNSRVLVVGAGGLGSPALFYLAGAGVGTIGIADGDRVALSNLQRQILHTARDLDELKTDSAKDKLLRLNPDLAIELYSEPVTEKNGVELIGKYEFVIDATDNFSTKFLINDICVDLGIPFCHAGVSEMFGQMLTVVPGKGACYRCVFGDIPEKDPTAGAGILGAVSGVFGALQATEAVKFLIGSGKLLVGRLLTYDALNLTFREIKLPPPSCKVCRAAKHI